MTFLRRARVAFNVLFGKRRDASIFKGAEVSRILLDWIATCLKPDEEIKRDIRRTRARARDLARNNPYARHYLRMLQVNVIGASGFRMQAQVRNGNGDLDRATNLAIEEAWKQWAGEPVTVDRKLNLVQLEHLLIATLAKEGEAFVRKFEDDRINRYGLAYQVIDADLIDDTYHRAKTNDQTEIRMGVEINSFGRAIAYHVWNDYENSASGANRFRYRVPASEMIHLYMPDRPNQTRGITWLNPVMAAMKMLDGYEESEAVAARVAAAKMGWFERIEGSMVGESLPDPNNPLGRNVPMEANPGSIGYTPDGYKFNSWDPQHPSSQYPDFVKASLRRIATGLGVSYNALANDLEGVNYSSMRSGLLLERDLWRTLQEYWIAAFRVPTYRTWIGTALLTNALTLKTRDPRPFYAVRCRGRGWPWVDPLKDVAAAQEAIAWNLSSYDEEMDTRGLDLETVIEQNAEAKKLAEQYGVELVRPATGAKEAAKAAAEEEERAAPTNGNGDRANRLAGHA